jgi:hypothetical protein
VATSSRTAARRDDSDDTFALFGAETCGIDWTSKEIVGGQPNLTSESSLKGIQRAKIAARRGKSQACRDRQTVRIFYCLVCQAEPVLELQVAHVLANFVGHVRKL